MSVSVTESSPVSNPKQRYTVLKGSKPTHITKSVVGEKTVELGEFEENGMDGDEDLDFAVRSEGSDYEEVGGDESEDIDAVVHSLVHDPDHEHETLDNSEDKLEDYEVEAGFEKEEAKEVE